MPLKASIEDLNLLFYTEKFVSYIYIAQFYKIPHNLEILIRVGVLFNNISHVSRRCIDTWAYSSRLYSSWKNSLFVLKISIQNIIEPKNRNICALIW